MAVNSNTDHPENFFIVRIRTQSLSYGKTIAIDQLSQAAGSKDPEVLFLILFSRPDEGRRPCLLPNPEVLFLIPFPDAGTLAPVTGTENEKESA